MPSFQFPLKRALLMVLLCVLPLLHLSQSPRSAQSATDVVFTNDTDINIYVARADVRRASPYPSTIAVNGLAGKISGVQVRLLGLTHYRPDDLDILLVSPTDRRVLLMSDAGGDTDISALNLTFASTGTAIPDASALSSGTYQPGDYEPGTDVFDAPAPYKWFSTDLSRFHEDSPNGTWSLYVMDDYGWTNPGSISGWSLSLTLDSTAPVSTLTSTTAPNANGWYKGPVELLLEAVDDPGGAGVTSLHVHIVRNGDEQIMNTYLPGDSAALPVLTLDGLYDVSYFAVDGVRNAEAERTTTIRIDTVGPEIGALSVQLGFGSASPASVPLRLSVWATDEPESSSSGIRRFTYQKRTNNGPWQAIPGASAALEPKVVPGNTYQFRAWATDRAGNRSPTAVSERMRVTLHQESSAAIVDTGVWTTGDAAYASGGRVQYATAAGREVLFTYSGTSVAWVTTIGPNRGIAEYAVDERWFGDREDLYSATLKGAYIRRVISHSSDIRTFSVRVTGTANPASSGSRVDVDAFVVLSVVP